MSKRNYVEDFKRKIKGNQARLSDYGVKKNARIIVISGIDGSGKSDLASYIGSSLICRDYPMFLCDDDEGDDFKPIRDKYKTDPNINPRVLIEVKGAGLRLHLERWAKRYGEAKTLVMERNYLDVIVDYLKRIEKDRLVPQSQIEAIIKGNVRSASQLVTTLMTYYMSQTYFVPDMHIVLDTEPEVGSIRIAERYRKLGKRVDQEEDPILIAKSRPWFLRFLGCKPEQIREMTGALEVKGISPTTIIINTSQPQERVIREAIASIHKNYPGQYQVAETSENDRNLERTSASNGGSTNK